MQSLWIGTKNTVHLASLKFEKQFRLISDQAGSLGACEVAKEMAEEWSKKLATHLQMKLLKTDDGKESIELPGFYFTFSTQIQLKQVTL